MTNRQNTPNIFVDQTKVTNGELLKSICQSTRKTKLDLKTPQRSENSKM